MTGGARRAASQSEAELPECVEDLILLAVQRCLQDADSNAHKGHRVELRLELQDEEQRFCRSFEVCSAPLANAALV